MGKRAAYIFAAVLFSAILALPLTAGASGSRLPEPRDTTMHNATKTLIESFGELSRTASKLSETTLKLLEAQEKALSEEEEKGSGKRKPATPKKGNANKPASGSAAKPKTAGSAAGKVYIEDDEETDFEPELPTGGEDADLPVGGRVYISDETDLTPDSETPVDADDDTQQYDAPELRSLWDLQGDEAGDGKYIWIPDENRYAVEQILKGKTVDFGKGEPDLNEMTYWRGDSIPMALHTRRLGRFDRKLYNWLIYPRGTWQISMTASYGELSTEDSEFLSLIDDVDIMAKSYSVKPAVGYFLRSNLCLGLRFAYTRGEANVNSFNVDIDEDLNFNLHDINFISEKYSAAIFLQQYFGLSRRGRFAVFNEAELAVGSGNKYFTRPFGGEIRQTRSKTQSVNLNYSPGVSILLMKNAAFNLSFGVFGFHLTHEKQWENGEESGSRLTSGINFRFNIFNINFGVSIMI